jgi:uroporphyrinogen-III synthase
MAGTRSSTRKAEQQSSSPVKGNDATAGSKRKPEAEPSPKRGRKATKKQTTIEQSMDVTKEEDSEMKDASDEDQDAKKSDASQEKVDENMVETSDDKALVAGDDAKTSATNEEDQADSTANADTGAQDQDESKPDDVAKTSSTNDDGPIEESSQRAKQVPSNILEKGIIYFFTRNRVGIEDSESVGDLQRTFFVLRPMPTGAKLGDGALADDNNNRLFALPKKVFPKSHNDRFMAFVEKANTTVKELKETFFGAEEYETKTQGTRKNEPVAPVAEGVYAITRTEDRTTHLVYSTTIPSALGEVQEDLGIKDQGSFIMSVKNPERSGPASAQLPQKPDFPKE